MKRLVHRQAEDAINHAPVAPFAGVETLRINTLDVLSLRTRRALESIAQARSWRDGDILLHAGDVAPWALLITAGRLRVSTVTLRGTEQIRRWLRTEELIGLAPVLSGQPFAFSIVASGNCRTSHFPADALLRLMRADGEVAVDIAMLLARKVLELAETSVELSHGSLEEKVYSTLQRLARVDASRKDVDGTQLRISQNDLACMVGSCRQQVNATLHSLRRQGLIRIGYRTILLLDAPMRRAAD